MVLAKRGPHSGSSLMPTCSAVMLVQAELKMLGINNVGIHNLSPGMVTTDLLMAGAPILNLPHFHRRTSTALTVEACGMQSRRQGLQRYAER